MTTYDRMYSRGYRIKSGPDLSQLDSCVVIVADDIAEQAFNFQPNIPWEGAYPSIVPPFDCCFIETRAPNLENIKKADHFPYRWGALCAKLKIPSGWKVHFSMSLEIRKGEFNPNAAEYLFALKGDGSIENETANYPAEIGEVARAHLDAYMQPILLALSLMNCKNIRLVDNLPPAKLSKSHKNKTGVPLVTFKTIKVDPLRPSKHSESEEFRIERDKLPSDHPLSIWRGHFKDYRAGNGLFGNASLKGIYWWDQHARGSKESGITVKDYRVLPKDE